MNRILVLGSGLVSRPGIKYLLNQKEFLLTVASNELAKAIELIRDYPNAKAVEIDADNNESLKAIIKENDIVISLLPWTYHLKVAEICLNFGKHMVTASYVGEGMKKLDKEVKQKNLVFLNEIGLDPGIDHMSSMNTIDNVHAEGGKVLHFYSCCGGLPAPEDNNNPFGYKFSWSPRGVVLASRNSARYLENGKIVQIESKELFLNYETEEIEELGKYEVYPNRDSIPYKELYGLKDSLTVKRGTYRNLGWCSTFKKIVDLDLIDDTPREELKDTTFKKMMGDLVGSSPGDNVKLKVAERINVPINDSIILKLNWLGLFSDEKVPHFNNRLDIFCGLFQKKLVYSEGEKDMVILRHKFIVENVDKTKDIVTSTLIDFGIPFGDTSMARTVSLPLAIGTKLIAENKIKSKGVIIPTIKEIYDPVLNELANLNIRMVEIRKKLE
jgi:saccharopine dehydrogenase (NADP+, L-glutamate forming)